MKHLYLIVEGETETEFVNKLLIPYFNNLGLNTHIQAIMIKKSGGGHGYDNIEHFKNTVKPVLSIQNEPIITMMLDYYGMDSDKKVPNYTACLKFNSVDDKLKCLENSFNEVVQTIKPYAFFVPYIQKYELETFLFAEPEKAFEFEHFNIKNAVLRVRQQYQNAEDINNQRETAPSKRLIAIYSENHQKYEKGAEAVEKMELVGMPILLEKCPKFCSWIEKLIQMLKNS